MCFAECEDCKTCYQERVIIILNRNSSGLCHSLKFNVVWRASTTTRCIVNEESVISWTQHWTFPAFLLHVSNDLFLYYPWLNVLCLCTLRLQGHAIDSGLLWTTTRKALYVFLVLLMSAFSSLQNILRSDSSLFLPDRLADPSITRLKIALPPQHCLALPFDWGNILMLL